MMKVYFKKSTNTYFQCINAIKKNLSRGKTNMWNITSCYTHQYISFNVSNNKRFFFNASLWKISLNIIQYIIKGIRVNILVRIR